LSPFFAEDSWWVGGGTRAKETIKPPTTPPPTDGPPLGSPKKNYPKIIRNKKMFQELREKGPGWVTAARLDNLHQGLV